MHIMFIWVCGTGNVFQTIDESGEEAFHLTSMEKEERKKRSRREKEERKKRKRREKEERKKRSKSED